MPLLSPLKTSARSAMFVKCFKHERLVKLLKAVMALDLFSDNYVRLCSKVSYDSKICRVRGSFIKIDYGLNKIFEMF